MSSETTSSADSTNQPLPSSEPPRAPATPAPAGAGPLARFTRATEASETPATGESPKPEQAAAAPPPAATGASSASPPAGFRPRSRNERPKSRREKERDEDRQLDRELAAERQSREERIKHGVPVPNLRQRSEELEAEVAAALGDVSLEEIVK